MTMASVSFSPAAVEQHDLPSPRIGEDFDLCRHLKKDGITFLAKWRLSYKGEDKTMLEIPEPPDGAAYRWGRANWVFRALVAPLA
jgi:hypothetical protein